jgi:hypothetical protein
VDRAAETISGLEDEYRLAQPLPKLLYIKHTATRDDRLNELILRIESENKPAIAFSRKRPSCRS